jgi:hypothetical protein
MNSTGLNRTSETDELIRSFQISSEDAGDAIVQVHLTDKLQNFHVESADVNIVLIRRMRACCIKLLSEVTLCWRHRTMSSIDALQLTVIVNITLLASAASLSLIYTMTVACVARLHTAINILTGHFCFVSTLCCLFWIIHNYRLAFQQDFHEQSIAICIFTRYGPELVNCLVIYALLTITINRFLIVIYPNKGLFKRQTWSMITLIIQWLVTWLLTCPQLVNALIVTIYLLIHTHDDHRTFVYCCF